MNRSRRTYVDLEGAEWELSLLSADERRLLSELQKKAVVCEQSTDMATQRWCDFDNYWMPKVLAFYKSRKLTRKQTMRTAIFQIAHDMSGRLAIALGLARKADYRDRLLEIIETEFKTRREFCEKSGLPEDMLSHFLAGRKELSMGSLTQALDRIGYTIRFVPREATKTKSA